VTRWRVGVDSGDARDGTFPCPKAKAHPFFGTLTIYQWIELMAAHEGRHTEQIREIAAAFS